MVYNGNKKTGRRGLVGNYSMGAVSTLLPVALNWFKGWNKGLYVSLGGRWVKVCYIDSYSLDFVRCTKFDETIRSRV